MWIRFVLRGTLSKALPPMPQIKDMAMSPAKFIDAMEVANDTRAAYRHSRIADKRMRAVAKAKNYQATKAVERRARDVSRFNSKQVRAQAMHSRRTYKQHAENMGMDRSIFK